MQNISQGSQVVVKPVQTFNPIFAQISHQGHTANGKTGHGLGLGKPARGGLYSDLIGHGEHQESRLTNRGRGDKTGQEYQTASTSQHQ